MPQHICMCVTTCYNEPSVACLEVGYAVGGKVSEGTVGDQVGLFVGAPVGTVGVLVGTVLGDQVETKPPPARVM